MSHARTAARILAMLALLVAVVAVGSARAAAGPPTKLIRYHGYALRVPAAWPVFDLAAHPSDCVRFDRHAVYLGRPGAAQRCTAAAAGRTEAILVQPERRAATALALPSRTAAAPAAGSSTQFVNRAHGVVVTATWSRDRSVIARVLRVRRLIEGWALTLPEHVRPRAIAASPAAGMRAAHATSAHTASAHAAASGPGTVYTGLGFDACSTPSTGQMSAWAASPYRALGVYIGGANMACSQPNLTASWVNTESAAGWRIVPIYVGLQAPSNGCGCAPISASQATAQGTAAAQDAVAHAQAVGLGAGNPIYDDMEGYTRGSNTTAVMAFLAAWTTQLHAEGYGSGVYSSADSGMVDLVARYGTGYAEPDDIWIARWNNARNTDDPNVPGTEWASHQRLHQYGGAHNETYGGATINIDGDYLDGATAGTGNVTRQVAAAPSLSLRTIADGSINLRPSWTGATGIGSWQILAGPSPTALTPASAPVSAGSRMPITVRSSAPYFAVQALDASGAVLGISAPVSTPAHLAIFGRSAFVPKRGLAGVPVGCFELSSCHVTITITAGSLTIATTGPERIAVGGGLAYFQLTPEGRAKLARARRRHLLVRVSVRDAGGLTARRRVTLVAFTTSGPGSPRSGIPASASVLRTVGTTEFVSHGWTGGVLAGCFASTPCTGSFTISAGGQTIATATSQTLGAEELGYLFFTLTPEGHALLHQMAGNQLAATLETSTAGGSATAQIVLCAFR